MILDKTVAITMRGAVVNYYKEKGYVFDKNETIDVLITDLPLKSNKKIHVKCDYCGAEHFMAYSEYNRNIQHNQGKYGCHLCAGSRIQETIIKKYGKSHMLIPEIAEKQKKTNLLRYGVEHAAQCDMVKEKAKQTCIERYGYIAPTCNPIIREKVKNTTIERYGVEGVISLAEFKDKLIATNLNKYGVEYVLQSEDVKKKSKLTCLEKYGVENSMQCKEIREKAEITKYNNQSQQTSIQQKYLNTLYQGELNHPCSCYSLDIYLPSYHLDIEYNGGGHNLQVKIGDITEEEFKQKEITRSTQIKRQGINQLTIISRKDYLPSDDILLKMLQETLSYLSSTNHHWQEYDIDNQTLRNATDIYPYDFGDLRKIKKTDLNNKLNPNQEITKEAS